MAKDYYKILGIEKSASQDDIKKAYRRLAHKFHPDKAGGDEQKFKEINEAYQILSNTEKRARYDRFGSTEGFGGAPGSDFGFSPGGMHWEGSFSDLGDLGDIMESFFEDMGVRPRRKTYQRGSDLEVVLQITLEEAFRGATKEVRIKTHVKCRECEGRGALKDSDFETCATCSGQGEIREQKRTFFGGFSQVKACKECHGTGQIPKKVCKACGGSGKVPGERVVSVQILPGVQNGQIVKIQGMGEAGERGTADGDLYVHLKIASHTVFTRHGDDLLVARELDVLSLLRDSKIEVPTISGGKLHTEIPPSFDLKEALRIRGEGMPRLNSHGRGDLLVNLTVKTPKKINPRLKKFLDELQVE